uniref:Putative secreted protein n=1 Tax=Anopheles darlingi TaxID=43151 RepID=A0A2M4D973_ANODA
MMAAWFARCWALLCGRRSTGPVPLWIVRVSKANGTIDATAHTKTAAAHTWTARSCDSGCRSEATVGAIVVASS